MRGALRGHAFGRPILVGVPVLAPFICLDLEARLGIRSKQAMQEMQRSSETFVSLNMVLPSNFCCPEPLAQQWDVRPLNLAHYF